VLLALVIGGLTQVARQSHSYDVGANRSLAAQGSVVAGESAVTSAQQRHLMGDMATLDRRTLQSQLDSIVEQTADQSALSQRLAGSTALSSLAGQLALTFEDRAQAMQDMRSAIDGLLGMHPLPVTGASGSVSQSAVLTLLTSTQATDRFSSAGALLAQSDRMYRTVRADLRHDRGRFRLPASAWISDAQTWQVGALAAQVDLLAASGSLAVVHKLTLQTVRLFPPALPTAVSTAQGTSVLSPTNSVSVTVVLSNLGSVDEPRATVQFSLAPQTGGSALSRQRTVAVPSGGSVTLDTVTFGVKPGTTYQLVVAITVPAGQVSTADSTLSQTLQIAPST
jgi:hypothetical protein